jgi:hypothetical protein
MLTHSFNGCRHKREEEDTPLLRDSRDVVAALLASASLLSPTNMAAAAELLAGPCAAAGGTGFAGYAKGQAALSQGALRWFVSQAPEAAAFVQGELAAVRLRSSKSRPKSLSAHSPAGYGVSA